ncbi:hypothetical protein IQ255_24915 [Pleurocapsales cyanobacterium LEGE 10410]|nr:hypothetical protein [Pleurocapsales cyanobacterium LEGE 10410]
MQRDINIITYQNNNSKLSPVPPVFWTLPKSIYDELIERYPSLVDKSNDTAKLEWNIIDKFLYGRNEIQVSQSFVLNLCGKYNEASLPYIQQAISNLDDLCELKDFGSDINLTLNIDVEIDDSSYFRGHSSRALVYCLHQEFEVLKHKYQRAKTTDEYVYVLSGNKVSPKSKKTIKTKLLEYQEELESFYQEKDMLPEMIGYCDLVNELANNQTRLRLITKNIGDAEAKLEEWFECGIEPCESVDAYLHHKRSIIRVRDNVLNVYRLVKSNSPRVFDLVDQNLHKKLREIIYQGCSDVDLSRSQLAIIASLSNDDELRQWLEHDDLWLKIGLETNFPKPVLKKATYTLCFGGSPKTWVKEGLISEEEANELKQYPFFKTLHKVARDLRSSINKDKYVVVGNKKLALGKGFRSRHALARKVQYIESMIIYEVLQAVRNDNRITLIGAYHDGILVNFRDKDEKRIHKCLKSMNQVAQDKALRFGVDNISLEIKD